MIEDIQKTLWATAYKLRADMASAECKRIVLGLIFVKHITDILKFMRCAGGLCVSTH